MAEGQLATEAAWDAGANDGMAAAASLISEVSRPTDCVMEPEGAMEEEEVLDEFDGAAADAASVADAATLLGRGGGGVMGTMGSGCASASLRCSGSGGVAVTPFEAWGSVAISMSELLVLGSTGENRWADTTAPSLDEAGITGGVFDGVGGLESGGLGPRDVRPDLP